MFLGMGWDVSTINPTRSGNVWINEVGNETQPRGSRPTCSSDHVTAEYTFFSIIIDQAQTIRQPGWQTGAEYISFHPRNENEL